MANYTNEFISEHKLDEAFFKRYETVFRRYEKSRHLCENCQGLFTCSQKSIGERTSLSLDGNVLVEGLEYCDFLRQKKNIEELRRSYVYTDIPDNLLSLSLNNVEVPDDNIKLYLLKCLNIYNEKTAKGLYVYGDLGVGKTYMMVALANSLVKKGKSVAFVKITSFINDMRKLVSNDDGEYERVIDSLKKCDYLFIDDLGSESVTTFSRDDILFNVLDYRLSNGKTTSFNSNYDKKKLEEYYAVEKSGKISTMHARRLLERIDILSETFALTGNNKRRV